MSKTSTDKYVDPPNAPEILDNMRNLPTLGHVKALLDETFPTWFVTTMEIFCPDYPHLNKNWRSICKKSNTKRTQVMIVDEILFDESHSLVTHFSECFTRAGFAVRRKQEFIPCENCGSAVPTQVMWQLFKEKGNVQIPKVWSSKCVGC